MAHPQMVTVDKSYFDALLRRADFHTSGKAPGSTSTFANVTISRAEYDSLLRSQRELQLLKGALYEGGLTPGTIATLVSQMSNYEERKDSGASSFACPDDVAENVACTQGSLQAQSLHKTNIAPAFNGMEWRANSKSHRHQHDRSVDVAPNGYRPLLTREGLLAPSSLQQAGHGLLSKTGTSSPDEYGIDENDGFEDEHVSHVCNNSNGEPRTLYFCGFAEGTTYKDLLSVIKGGKVLHIQFHSERSASVSFVQSTSAVSFLAWAKRKDIYINHKRIDVRWAERQFHLTGHSASKIADGATRNFIVHKALDKGLTASQIREDMGHIHKLVIVDITYQGSDAYVSTNAVHNALFAKTCMLSRTTYKGCRVEPYKDECDVPLPERVGTGPVAKPAPIHKVTTGYNRFGLLNIDGTEGDSDEENRTPIDDDEESSELTSFHGVNLRFLDAESTV